MWGMASLCRLSYLCSQFWAKTFLKKKILCLIILCSRSYCGQFLLCLGNGVSKIEVITENPTLQTVALGCLGTLKSRATHRKKQN